MVEKGDLIVDDGGSVDISQHATPTRRERGRDTGNEPLRDSVEIIRLVK